VPLAFAGRDYDTGLERPSRLRLFDGGVSDNRGLIPISGAFALSRQNQDWGMWHFKQLIIVDAGQMLGSTRIRGHEPNGSEAIDLMYARVSSRWDKSSKRYGVPEPIVLSPIDYVHFPLQPEDFREDVVIKLLTDKTIQATHDEKKRFCARPAHFCYHRYSE
jgi:hypothetical protein